MSCHQGQGGCLFVLEILSFRIDFSSVSEKNFISISISLLPPPSFDQGSTSLRAAAKKKAAAFDERRVVVVVAANGNNRNPLGTEMFFEEFPFSFLETISDIFGAQ